MSRREVISLYRRCLRSSYLCPSYDSQQLMLELCRLRFRSNLKENPNNKQKIRSLLKAGEEELAQMNYYHSVRQRRNHNDKNQ